MGKWRCTHLNDLIVFSPLTMCSDTQLALQRIKDALYLCMLNLSIVCNVYNHDILSHRSGRIQHYSEVDNQSIIEEMQVNHSSISKAFW